MIKKHIILIAFLISCTADAVWFWSSSSGKSDTDLLDENDEREDIKWLLDALSQEETGHKALMKSRVVCHKGKDSNQLWLIVHPQDRAMCRYYHQLMSKHAPLIKQVVIESSLVESSLGDSAKYGELYEKVLALVALYKQLGVDKLEHGDFALNNQGHILYDDHVLHTQYFGNVYEFIKLTLEKPLQDSDKKALEMLPFDAKIVDDPVSHHID